MSAPLNDAALDQLFREARSYNGWLDEEVTEEQIRKIYALAKMGPTSANQQPGRFVLVQVAGVARQAGGPCERRQQGQDTHRARVPHHRL